MRDHEVVLTCEHGGNRVPARYERLFRGAVGVLASHRGWDPGALGVARRLARRLRAPLHHATVTRLLVELNCSEGSSRLFSEFSAGLEAEERERILARYYRPYRREVERRIASRIAAGRVVLHLSFHTFTPVLDGDVRRADVGLLYDPARSRERLLCARWRELLLEGSPGLRVRRNYPYRGAADGLTTTLRGRFPASRYLGIELEIGQRFFTADGRPRSDVVRKVETSLERLLASGNFRNRGF